MVTICSLGVELLAQTAASLVCVVSWLCLHAPAAALRYAEAGTAFQVLASPAQQLSCAHPPWLCWLLWACPCRRRWLFLLACPPTRTPLLVLAVNVSPMGSSCLWGQGLACPARQPWCALPPWLCWLRWGPTLRSHRRCGCISGLHACMSALLPELPPSSQGHRSGIACRRSSLCLEVIWSN